MSTEPGALRPPRATNAEQTRMTALPSPGVDPRSLRRRVVVLDVEITLHVHRRDPFRLGLLVEKLLRAALFEPTTGLGRLHTTEIRVEGRDGRDDFLCAR